MPYISLTIIDQKKAIEIMGSDDWAWFKANVPISPTQRDFNGMDIVTLLHGDHIFIDWRKPYRWRDYWNLTSHPREIDLNKAKELVDKLSGAILNVWSV